MLLEVPAWSPKCKICHPKCTSNHPNQGKIPTPTGLCPLHGSAALTPVCHVYSGAFRTGPGAVDSHFKLHHPQQQADGLTASVLHLLPHINITLQTKSESCSRSEILSQLALSQINFAMPTVAKLLFAHWGCRTSCIFQVLPVIPTATQSSPARSLHTNS